MGKVLLEADLSQIEMRVIAHLSHCRRFIDIFLRGGDPHTETAVQIFGLPFDVAKQDKYRYPTKRLNFGIIYGITSEGLAADIEEHVADIVDEGGNKDDFVVWSIDDCSRLIDEWNGLYPEIKDFRLEQIAHARRYGYVKDMFGRIRFVPEIYCPVRSILEAGERQAGNMPVQCLPASTRIRTKRGYERIGDFVSGDIWTGSKWVGATKIDKGTGELVKVHVSDGAEFVCDTAHNLLVNRGVWPEWVNVMKIKDGDVLLSGNPKDTINMDEGLQIEDTEFWYWIGRYYGDGHLTHITPETQKKKRGSRHSVCWAFGGTKINEVQRCIDYLGTHGYEPHIRECRKLTKLGTRHHSVALLTSYKFNKIMMEYGIVPNETAATKRVADIVFKLDIPRKMAFLDGYYDADGTRRKKNPTDWSAISATSISKGLLIDMMLLLRSVGRRAYLLGPYQQKNPRHKPFWKIRVKSNNDDEWWGSKVENKAWQRVYSMRGSERRMVSAEMLGVEERIYTLSVNDEHHSFDSEGLISENSSATGIIKLAMIKLFQERNEQKLFDRVKFLLQIHDSLLLEMDDDPEFVLNRAKWLHDTMCEVVKLLVPIEAEVKTGKTWADMTPLDLKAKVMV